MPVIAPWLQTTPRDYIAAAESGAARGQQDRFERDRMAQQSAQSAQTAAMEQQRIALEGQRLAEQEKQAQLQLQLQKEQHDREYLLGQQRNQIAQAYHIASVGIQKQRLAEAAQLSARKYAAQQKLAALTAQGVPFEKAILQVPELMGTGAEAAMLRAQTTHPASPRMEEVDKLKYSTAQKELAAGEKELQGVGWFGSKKKPNEKIESAKKVMQEIEQKYSVGPAGRAPAAAAGGADAGVTHKFNRQTGKIEVIASPETQAAAPLEMSPSGVPLLPSAGNTYGGVLPNEHFREVNE